MIDDQQLSGTGFNGDHIVFSSFFEDNHIVQQTAIVHPKTLLIDSLRKVFRNDSIFTYRDDEYGYPLTPDQTGVDVDTDATTKILISDSYRYEVKFFPAIVIKSNGGQYKPLSFNQNMTYQYRSDLIEDEFGVRKIIDTPTHRVYTGRWELGFEVGIYSESQSELEELTDIVSLALQYVLWNELRANGLFLSQVRIGAESAEPYANDYVYSTAISLSTMSEWRVEVPIENIVEKIAFSIQPTWHPIPGVKGKADLMASRFDDLIELTEIS
tara:strand:- start:150 stop:959 length:810 start_codon:yes stop_codon:yes gene_type:complete